MRILSKGVDSEDAILSIFAPIELNGKATIQDIRVIKYKDPCNESCSSYGKYTDSPPEKGHAIDRKETGDWREGERRYFIPAYWDENDPDIGLSDYRRAETINDGDIFLFDLVVEATISIVFSNDVKKEHIIYKTCCAELESDSDTQYLLSILRDGFDEMRDKLIEFGFSHAELDWWEYKLLQSNPDMWDEVEYK